MIPLTPTMLLVALIITTPTALDAFQGTTSATDALNRYIVVTVIIWGATSLIHSLFIPPANERQAIVRATNGVDQPDNQSGHPSGNSAHIATQPAADPSPQQPPASDTPRSAP